jgi:hypothetical protein
VRQQGGHERGCQPMVHLLRFGPDCAGKAHDAAGSLAFARMHHNRAPAFRKTATGGMPLPVPGCT